MSTGPDGTRRGLLAGAAALALARPAAAAPGRSGLDLAGMDRRVAPGDDFFRYANGRWCDSYVFRDDEAQAGARASMGNLRRERIQALVERAAGERFASGPTQQIGALYASFMDVARRDAAGLTPLQPDLDAIAAVGDVQALARLFGAAPRRGLASPFEGSVFYDFHEPGRLRYTLTPGGLGLPSREHYLEPRYAPERAAYRDYVAAILARGGQAAEAADRVVALETALAGAYWPTAEAQNFVKTSNNLDPAALKALAPAFPWAAFLDGAGAADADVIIVRQPPVMPPAARIILETPLEVWKAYLVFHLISDNAEHLTTDLGEARFRFYGARLSGLKAQRPLTSRGAELVETLLPQQLGRLYVERFVDPRTKPIVEEIFGHVRAVMRDRIERSTWMSPPTRAEALRKIDTLKVKLVYPDVWSEAIEASFQPDDLYGNLRRAREAGWRLRLRRTRRPLDPREWQTSPQNTSAAANPAANEITAPAGALVPPYFDPRAAPAVNYGAIGGVLGHELSHLFDQVGRRLDANGRLRDWWAPADARRYEAVAARVERQYAQFEPLPGRRLDGRQTLNENIADISGLDLAYAAFHRAFPKASGKIDGLTPNQQFFLGWAQMRRGKLREPALIAQLATGVHSPDMYRVNGVVRNLDAWYAAFDVRPGTALYLPPAERARFW